MSEPKPKDSATWTWIAVAMVVVVGCLGLLACVGLIGATFLFIVPAQIDTGPTVTSTDGTAGPAPLQDSDYVGLWQFPDRWVWIKITAEGQVFQCRIATDRTVYRSEGVLIEGDQIVWEEIWGVDSIRSGANSVILDGKYGEFEYVPAENEMDPACEAPF